MCTETISFQYLSSNTVLAAIYGAGTNGSYTETSAAITKLPNFQYPTMMINTEWGAFSQVRQALI
jgi:hexokinase